ncbi:TylF/MycF/NovP-related O-methyltransferase [Mycobacterium sp. NPDC051804]|uniref:TylF/MycF/NovP-related O-methyltransferase n=1 Tax=Mycobacterium sp. NPDC051804 TaxID=3364295 RepID=UPI0037A92E8A
MAKRVLAATSGRFEYYVARSMYEPYESLDVSPFGRMNRRGFVDYVRWSTAELLKREIVERGIAGAVAEVGVGEGDFAWLLNHYFSDRKLYLFDTFSGFDSRDQDADVHAGLPSQPYPDPVASAVQVRDHLPNPELVDLRVGWFPESAAGLEGETFAFVHVDVGLHRPTLAALQWFFPRLAAHGYLLVADYGTSHTPGVRQAVREFASTSGAAYVVLPDRSGTAVFTKMS